MHKIIKRLTLLIIFSTVLSAGYVFSQAKLEIKEMFFDAESWILFEDFEEALPLYLQLNKFYPTNSNYKFRLGQCYLNIPGEKDKAIGYLEDAVKNINPKYREGKYKENGAPYDALYYLANAYRVNNQLDKAIETYETFKKDLDTKIYNPEIVEEQIQSCLNAKELMQNPLYVREKNLGNNINENNSEFNPVISDNERVMIFSKSEAFYDAILYSTKENGEWSGLINLNEALRVDADLYPTSLSDDGKTLFLYSSAGYDGVIYYSTFENGQWSPIMKLNDNINTKYWESHATISHDNNKLYFTSNRKNTIGGLDIYVSERDSTGDWGPAVNLGPVINTKYHEDTPFLSKDDKTLFFSSRGHFNMGGYDIFYSTLQSSGEWSIPLNAGYPLNSTDDDLFFKPINDGYEGYIAKYDPDGFGGRDIYRVEIFSDDHPRKFTVRGIARIADLIRGMGERIKVSAIDTSDPEKTVIVYSNPQTGEYEFQVPQGNYLITYEGPDGQITSRNLNLGLTHPSDSLIMPGTILPKTDFVADLHIEDTSIVATAVRDTVVIPVKTESGSLLTVEHWIGDSLAYTEQYEVNDTIFNYALVPSAGENKITFKITDRFSNTTTADIFITGKEPEPLTGIVSPQHEKLTTEKQIAAMTDMQKRYADNELRKIISDADIEDQEFASVDDQILYIKEKALQQGIKAGEIDMLALTVAVNENILSQAAVNLLVENTEGELKQILSETDIYELNLKTWNDLKNYINQKSQGRISPESLDEIAHALIEAPDKSILSGRDKFLAIDAGTQTGSILRDAISATGQKGIRDAGEWLQSVYNESAERGLTDEQFAEALAAVSSLPDTDVRKYLRDLISVAEEPFRSWLSSLDLDKEKIRTPAELLSFILKNRDKIDPEEVIFRAVAELIASKDIPLEKISETTRVEKSKYTFLWLLLGAGLIFFFIWFLKRRKEKEEDKN